MSVEVGILISIASLVLGYLGYQLNRTKDVKKESQDSAEVKAELGYIRKGVDDIRIDQKVSERHLVDLGERITRVEESTKQAHKRIDSIDCD